MPGKCERCWDWILHLKATLSKLRIGSQFFSQTAAQFFPPYAQNQECGPQLSCALRVDVSPETVSSLLHGDALTLPRFIDKFTNVMMTFHAYMNEIECWKNQELFDDLYVFSAGGMIRQIARSRKLLKPVPKP